MLVSCTVNVVGVPWPPVACVGVSVVSTPRLFEDPTAPMVPVPARIIVPCTDPDVPPDVAVTVKLYVPAISASVDRRFSGMVIDPVAATVTLDCSVTHVGFTPVPARL